MGWRGLWRLRCFDGSGALSSDERRQTADTSELVDTTDAGPDELEAARTRFFYVVARTRMDLFLTIQRQFRDDRTVHVMLERREHDRRGQPGPVDFPDRRRQPDRRRPKDYWEDTAHHPAVLVPLARLREEGGDSGFLPSADVTEQDRKPTMEHGLIDEARVIAWVQEGRYVIQHFVPLVLAERDTLRSQLQDAIRRCKDLQEENDGLRAEVARATASRRQLEQGHADIVDSVGQFLTQMTHVLEPMRDMAEKLDQVRHRRDGAT
jgi:hypothetical protein